jgi:flagellin-specific chaperone FliS
MNRPHKLNPYKILQILFGGALDKIRRHAESNQQQPYTEKEQRISDEILSILAPGMLRHCFKQDGRQRYGALHMTDKHLIANAIARRFSPDISKSYIATVDIPLIVRIKSIMDGLFVNPNEQRIGIITPIDLSQLHYYRMNRSKLTKLIDIITGLN